MTCFNLHKPIKLLKNIVTGEKTQVYGYVPETKYHIGNPFHHRNQQKHTKCAGRGEPDWFDYEGVLHHEYVP